MNAMNRTKRARGRGFTLTELLVVISLMAFLMAMLVGAIRRMEVSQSRGETTARLHALSRALSIYRADWGDVPPWNPTGEAGGPPGAGLWTLVMLDYLPSSRFLHDPGSAGPATPWILNGGTRVEGVDAESNGGLLEIYNAAAGGSQVSPLTPQQRFSAYLALADPAAHASGPGGARFADYDEEANENFCTWMMQDAFTGEWKYQPVRAGSGWVVGDPASPDSYHRQLSRWGTDQPNKSYLPANDTVVTWSTAYRTTDRRPADVNGEHKNAWGIDIVLFADGHAAIVPAPFDTSGWAPPRATLRAPRQ